MTGDTATSPSQTTYDDLLSLARDRSVEGRNRLAETIEALFLDPQSNSRVGTLTDREHSLMGSILQRVLKEVEQTLRDRIMDDLSANPEAPPELMRVLAQDDIDIAFPILRNSPVLRDQDLIEIIRNRTLEHQLAIATRSGLGETVSAALVDSGQTSVIVRLLNNPDAKIHDSTMAYLVEESRRVDAFQEPILQREDLPSELAQRMFLWVSAALRTFIVERFKLPEDRVDDLLEQAVQDTDPGSSGAEVHPAANALAEDLSQSVEITPGLLLDTLSDGQVDLFVSLFTKATGLRDVLVRRLLFEPGGEGMAIACRALGFTAEEFSVLFLLSRRARVESLATTNKRKADALALFKGAPVAICQRVVAKWTRNPKYLMALRSLESARDQLYHAQQAEPASPQPSAPTAGGPP
ncbi:MAG: DUF2336 domain-containing protein [Rhodospirillaceae bacterium]